VERNLFSGEAKRNKEDTWRRLRGGRELFSFVVEKEIRMRGHLTLSPGIRMRGHLTLSL
jgi:hypothetical protein